MMMDHGTTLTQEKAKNPGSDYLKSIGSFVRSYEESVAYAPNQVFIGNMKPSDLAGVATPWYKNPVEPKNSSISLIKFLLSFPYNNNISIFILNLF